MWKARRPAQCRNAQGFAAVEMLVTVAIVVLIGTISIFALGRTDKAQLESDVAAIALMFQQARLQAAETGLPVEVIYSQPDMRVSTPIDTHVFGRGVTSPTGSTTVVIRPSGESEGLALELAAGDMTRTVVLDWLTGQVRLSP